MLQPIQLAKNGPLLSPIVLGVMKWGVWGKQHDAQAMLRLIEESIALGVTSFDHADIYGHYTTEAEFGAALSLKPALRDQMQLITKCGIKLVTPNRPSYKIKSYDTSKEYIIWSAEQSLKNLRTDRIDLFLIHRPSPLMDPDEIAEAFEVLKKAGKVLHFGVSNFTPSQFDLLNDRFPLVTNQIQANIMHLEPFLDGTLDQCLRHRIRPMAWAPLGGGDFFTKLDDPKVKRIRAVLNELSDKKSAAAIDQLVLAWLMRHPSGILPVIGTGRVERVRSAVGAMKVEYTREEWFEVWEASVGREVA
jgi:predicted oxidoreductase